MTNKEMIKAEVGDYVRARPKGGSYCNAEVTGIKNNQCFLLKKDKDGVLLYGLWIDLEDVVAIIKKGNRET